MKRLNKIVRVRLTDEQVKCLQGKNASLIIRLALAAYMNEPTPF